MTIRHHWRHQSFFHKDFGRSWRLQGSFESERGDIVVLTWDVFEVKTRKRCHPVSHLCEECHPCLDYSQVQHVEFLHQQLCVPFTRRRQITSAEATQRLVTNPSYPTMFLVAGNTICSTYNRFSLIGEVRTIQSPS